VVNGLVLGGYYLLITLGLSLIFSVGGVVNLAHGAFYALGAYASVELTKYLGFGPAVVISLEVVLNCFAAAAFDRPKSTRARTIASRPFGVRGHSCGCPFGSPRIAGVWRLQSSRSGPNGQPPERSQRILVSVHSVSPRRGRGPPHRLRQTHARRHGCRD
jgi:hypothetical protein